MSSLENIIKNKLLIKYILNKSGLEKALLFQGFSDEEEHNLNISIIDKYHPDDEEVRNIYLRIDDAENELIKLLNCNIKVILKGDIDPFYLPYIAEGIDFEALLQQQ